MSLTAGQKQYLLELLSHEYVLTEEQQPAVRQAICRYATAVYDQEELDFLLKLPQSPAACLYYQGGRQGFSRRYALWLNCLEYCIYEEEDGLEAVLLNPDPTGSEPLLALVRQEDDTLEAVPLPQLRFAREPQGEGVSRWSLDDARESMRQFIGYAHNSDGTQESETLSWADLLLQARLFPMVKESYVFAGYEHGLPRPSSRAQLRREPQARRAARQSAPRRGWIYQPPASPFAAEKKLVQQMKQSFAGLPQRRPFHLPSPPSLPSLPAPPHISLPPFPGRRKPF